MFVGKPPEDSHHKGTVTSKSHVMTSSGRGYARSVTQTTKKAMVSRSRCTRIKVIRRLCHNVYPQVSNIRRTKSQHLKERFSYCLTAVFAESLEAMCQVENGDVVGAAPTGDAPTTSEWSTVLLPIKMRLILEILRYIVLMGHLKLHLLSSQHDGCACSGAHDDVIKWKHFPRNWPFVRGIHRSPVNSPHKGQWRGTLMFSLICARVNCWVNNREAGDLGRHRTHYVVIVKYMAISATIMMTEGGRFICISKCNWFVDNIFCHHVKTGMRLVQQIFSTLLSDMVNNLQAMFKCLFWNQICVLLFAIHNFGSGYILAPYKCQYITWIKNDWQLYSLGCIRHQV